MVLKAVKEMEIKGVGKNNRKKKWTYVCFGTMIIGDEDGVE